MNQADTLELLRKMRMDLTQLQARLTSVIESVASMPAGAATAFFTCPIAACQLHVRTEARLVEHLRNVHGQLLDDIEAVA